MLNMSKLGYETLADSMNQLLYDRIASGNPVEVLSTRNDKLLQVVEASDGERFVTRSYTPEAVEEIEYNYGLDFQTSWHGLNEALTAVDIEIVPSRLIEVEGGEYPFIIVSEYLDDAKPLADASTDVKKDVATGLSKLLVTDGDFVPAPEMVREDMFLVVERDDHEKALLTDVDPLVAMTYRIQKSDRNSAFYIDKLAELAWDKWCSGDDERKKMTTAMALVLGDFALDDFDLDSSTSRAFMDLHMMSNGVDNRQMWESRSS